MTYKKKNSKTKSKTKSKSNTIKNNTIKSNTIKNNTIKKFDKDIIEDKPVKFTSKINKCKLINKTHLYFLYLYFGIMSKLVNGNIELNKKYNLFYSKNEQKQKLINHTKSFTLIDKLKCFFYTSEIPSNHNTDILLCNVNDNKDNYIFICFRIGLAQYYETTKSLYYYIKKDIVKIDDTKIDNEIIYKPRFYELIILLSHIKHYLELNTYKNIMLCGHSRGNTIATFCAYILLILSSDDDTLSKLPKHHNIKEFIDKMKEYILDSNTQENILNKKLLEYKIVPNNLLEELKKLHKFNIICNDILNLKSIKKQIQNKIYICGTGGYPILWSKVEEFNIFNEFYLNKYINLISGNKENKIQIYDNLTYYNKFMYIYNKIEIIKNYNIYFKTNYNEKSNNLYTEIEKLKNIKNINYVYKNFGSIIFNLVDNNKIECYKMDSILNKLQKYDNKDKNKNRNYDKNKLLLYHRFEFYRYLFIKYMKFV